MIEEESDCGAKWLRNEVIAEGSGCEVVKESW